MAWLAGKAPAMAVFLALVVISGQAWAETVRLPMSIDFPLLRMLVVRQAYPEPGEKVTVIRQAPGCNEIHLANPQLAESGGRLQFTTEISLVWGAPLGSSCVAPLSWQGTVVFLQEPRVDAEWRLRFSTLDSMLLSANGTKTVIPGLVWNLVKENVHGYIESIAIDLAPPVTGLKQLMEPRPGTTISTGASDFIASMRADAVRVIPAGLALNILAEAEAAPQPEPPVTEADPVQQERLLALWQSWDALLVHMLEQFSTKPLTDDERQLLLDILLTARYSFAEVIGTPQLTTNFIRRQFIEAWVALKPLFENHLAPVPGENLLGYLSFFTAADALITLDRIGPMLGLDISREGFYRLAHMLSDTPLDESGQVDSGLRTLFGLGEPLAKEPVEAPESIEPSPETVEEVDDDWQPPLGPESVEPEEEVPVDRLRAML